MVILVGGPQYRVGSHRQFYYLARQLADNSFPALRFDYRGMGDSQGEFEGFENVDEDIRSAVDYLFERCASVKDVVLIGLCDAASSAMMYAASDSRVSGMVLMNPWIRTEQTLAKVTLKRYYLRRLVSRELWQKVLRGKFRPWQAFRSFSGTLKILGGAGSDSGSGRRPYPERMIAGLEAFRGQVLLILSGEDLTAMEFRDATAKDPRWSACFAGGNLDCRDFDEADHTFSSAERRGTVENWISGWLASW